MKVINHAEFEVGKALAARARIGVLARMKEGFAKLRGLFRHNYEIDRLSFRLIRDAGIEELEIERRLSTTAPMIR